MDNSIGMVFIHGAGLNSSVWNPLLKLIPYPVLTIDILNRKSEQYLNSRLSFEDYIELVSTDLKNWDISHFIIIAHSIGACVGLKVAENFKSKLKGFVAIGSVIPVSGQSFVSTLPFPQKIVMPIILSVFGTKPPEKAIVRELCNELPPQKIFEVVNEYTAESKELYTTKFTYNRQDIRYLYIRLNNDQSIPIDLQDKMAENLSASEIETLHCGHLPMLSNPNELANLLLNFVNDIAHEEV
ncbi:MAG TPA: alpha/beta hydrolase [Saprospiraceae bacterium]|nr:alpha/beta hydrolase [Saprospiraceae bacterium]